MRQRISVYNSFSSHDKEFFYYSYYKNSHTHTYIYILTCSTKQKEKMNNYCTQAKNRYKLIFVLILEYVSLLDVVDNYIQMGFVDIYDKNHLPIDLYPLMNVLNIHLYHNFVVVGDNL